MKIPTIKSKTPLLILITFWIVFGNQVSYAETITASTPVPLAEKTLHGSIVTLTLSDGTYEDWWVTDATEVSGIPGVTIKSRGVTRVSDTKITVKLEFDGNIDADATLTITVGADAIENYNGEALTDKITVTAVTETITASTTAPLTESTLHGSVVTLSLSGRTYVDYGYSNDVTVSGIPGVTIAEWRGVERVSDTQITVKLEFDGDIDDDATLTITVGADAIENYNGKPLTDKITVTAVAETITASRKSLTEDTLHGSVVTLTLSGRTYVDYGYSAAVAVSGIPGVTIKSRGVTRVSDTKITVKLEFDGNIDADATLTFTVGADAIESYGKPLTDKITVTAVAETITASRKSLTESTLHGSVVTLTLSGRTYVDYGYSAAVAVSGIPGVTIKSRGVTRVSDTKITVKLEFDGDIDDDATLTITVGADAIENYNGEALTDKITVTAVTETITASTTAPLTESTLHGSVVTLSLSGRTYVDYGYSAAVTVSGIPGVTIKSRGVTRVSDTQITVKLEFDGNIDADATLIFTVGADAIENYNGEALTDKITVTPVAETITASRKSLTESTLHESIVTLSLSGRTYERYGYSNDVTVSGIPGVTIDSVSRYSGQYTEIKVKLGFDGNIDADATLTITVGTDAIENYNGEALTDKITVTPVAETITASTPEPLTESVVTLTLSGRTYEYSSSTLSAAVAVSGIPGVTIDRVWRDIANEIRVKLEFDGEIDADATLTLTVGADAIEGYNGKPLSAKIPVTAVFSTWDVNQDGNVDILDLTAVAQNFETAAAAIPRADVNGDGTVDILDLVAVASHFEATTPAATKPAAPPGICFVGMTLKPGEGCSYSNYTFSIKENGVGCAYYSTSNERAGGCATQSINMYSFRTSKNGDGTWTINGL